MPDITPQTKSFFVLFMLAFFSVGLALILWSDLSTRPDEWSYYKNNLPPGYANNSDINSQILPQVEPVDTSAWKTYSNKEYGFSFKYKPEWKVLPPVKKRGFVIFQVDPGTKYYNFKIYASPDKYYIMDGLPAKTETIGGAFALNVKNSLYGITANNMHLTFDVSWSMQLLSEFNALVHSVEFHS